jgi:hypothetical protein
MDDLLQDLQCTIYEIVEAGIPRTRQEHRRKQLYFIHSSNVLKQNIIIV